MFYLNGLIILLGFILCFILLVYLNRMRYRHNKNEFIFAVMALLRKGFNGGALFIKPRKSPKLSIWFHKYIKSEDNYGVGLFFPKSNYREEYYETLLNYCIQQKINYGIVEEQRKTMPKDYVLCIDFGQDIYKAVSVAEYIFFNLFTLEESTYFLIYLENASYSDELVTNPSLSAKDIPFKKIVKDSLFILKKAQMNVREKV